MRAQTSAATIESMVVNLNQRAYRCTEEVEGVLATADHFAHRASGGFVVDLYWTRSDVGDHFRVEVEDQREGVCFVLYPATGRGAIRAFHHPFSTVRSLAS